MNMPPRFDITAEQIGTMVTAFYAEVRAHKMLGPVFANHINDWSAHEVKIASFWRGALLHEPGYSGFPQQVHMQHSDVMPEHFPVWLDLFEEVAFRVLPELPATAWVALARRIGGGMQMGVAQVRAPAGAVPNLN